jgi:hypothetical protein
MPTPETPLFCCEHTLAVATAAVLAALCSAPEGFEDECGFHPLTGNWEPANERNRPETAAPSA